MKSREIEAFRAVMRTGSMTAAAHLLHTTQPNISRFVASLERSTKLKLFERLPGRVIPTDEAAALYSEVERLYLGMDALERSVQIIRRSSTSKVRVATVASAAAVFVPKVISHFLGEHPNTQLSTQNDSSWGVANLVASLICDIGFVTHIGDVSGLRAEPLASFDAVCIVPEGHPLEQKRVVRPKDLAGEAFISLPFGHPSRTLIDEAFKESDARVHRLEIATSQSICDLVEAGLGVSVLNPLNIDPARQLRLRLKPFEPRLQFSTYLLTSSLRPTSPICGQFIAAARTVVREVEKELTGRQRRRGSPVSNRR